MQVTIGAQKYTFYVRHASLLLMNRSRMWTHKNCEDEGCLIHAHLTIYICIFLIISTYLNVCGSIVLLAPAFLPISLFLYNVSGYLLLLSLGQNAASFFFHSTVSKRKRLDGNIFPIHKCSERQLFLNIPTHSYNNVSDYVFICKE